MQWKEERRIILFSLWFFDTVNSTNAFTYIFYHLFVRYITSQILTTLCSCKNLFDTNNLAFFLIYKPFYVIKMNDKDTISEGILPYIDIMFFSFK